MLPTIDFTEIGKRSRYWPFTSLWPLSMSDLIAIGGIAPLMKRLLIKGLLHGECLTVNGKTLAENLVDVAIAAIKTFMPLINRSRRTVIAYLARQHCPRGCGGENQVKKAQCSPVKAVFDSKKMLWRLF